VLLGINLEAPGEEEMDTAPLRRKEHKERAEMQKPQAKEEKMDEDISPEKQKVCCFSIL
jgi:hypothetical protein